VMLHLGHAICWGGILCESLQTLLHFGQYVTMLLFENDFVPEGFVGRADGK